MALDIVLFQFKIIFSFPNRDELEITVEYVVTTELVEDDTKPWADVEYRANSSEETCQYGPSDLERCQNEWWDAKFKVQDEGTGLHLITVTNTGKPNYMNDVYYRLVILRQVHTMYNFHDSTDTLKF